ncbi:hypothetical protein KW795_00010 [Candidatus Microgenomates bacterium]|nr:hypothetical protein [Candidatus Microgenomates bacterium]
MLKKVYQQYLKSNLLLIKIIFLGSLSWIFVMVKSGYFYNGVDLGFWGANGHDGIWHLALAKSLARGSLDMPTFAGEKLKNYHIGFDLLLVLIHKLTLISIETLYFQILPIAFSVLIGIVTYKFVLNWKKSKEAGVWATFFIYFGGSFGWLVNLIRNGTIDGESMFWSQQSISTLINPPFALSLIFLFLGLNLLVKLNSNEIKNRKLLIFICVLIFGSLIEIKAYAGLLALGGLLVSGIFEFIKTKRIERLIIFIGSIVFSIILFLPLNKSSQGLLFFSPFWFLETLLGLSDRFYWPKLYEALMNYKLGSVWVKLIPAYVVAFTLFLIGNFGTRIIFIKDLIGKAKKFNFDSIDIFVYSMIAAGIVIPMLFLQSGTPWNTIQFFYYSLILLGILSGIVMVKMSKLLIVVIILVTVPTTIATLSYDYLPFRPPAKISGTELTALQFLSKQENGVVLTYPFDAAKSQEAINNPPRPLYLYESTAYVSAYSNKPVYLEDQVNLDITGYNWRERREKEDWFIKTTDQKDAENFLKENNIKYIYLAKSLSPLPGENLKLGTKQLNATNIFENSEIVILKMN